LPKRLSTHASDQDPREDREDRREDRQWQRSGAPGHIGLTNPLPAPLTSVAPLPLLRPRLLQTKLRIGALTDPLEREADRVADQVMRMSLTNAPSSDPGQIQRKCAACQKEEQEAAPSAPVQISRKCAHCQQEEDKLSSAGPRISRKCAHCEEEEKVMPKTSGIFSSSTQPPHPEAPPLVHQVLRSPGQPLADDDLAFFRPRFGFDFSHVRIHNDPTADESAHSVNALAYAAGSDIAFASGQYEPGTETGRRLLAHELAHVVQQSTGDHGHLRRLGDLTKVPAVLSCPIPPSSADKTDEYVLFPNSGTDLNGSQKVQVGNYVDRYHASGGKQTVRVDGFASEPGDDTLNWRLSCFRASSVRAELTHPSTTKTPGLPPFLVTAFMHGETREFGAEAQNRRATIFPPIAGSSQDKHTDQDSDKGKKGTDTTPPQGGDNGGGRPATPQDKPYPPTFFSCAVNPDCPKEYCTPFPTLKEALDDRAEDGESILSTIATANAHAEPLFRKYVFDPGPAGDISSEYAGDFASSRTTRAVTEQIFPLVRADIQSHPPDFPPEGGWVTVNFDTDPSKAALKQQFNELATNGLVFTDPFEVPGLFAGGVGANQGFCTVGANTTGAQPDSRSARVSAEVFKNPDGTLIINPIVIYTVVDTIDFCPGNCGGFFAQHLGNTVQMSRWEASGISGDVPFTVTFQGPSLIGAYNSED
jgi:outer membrane protein OmpA-like peptidoglycan-associated protein